MSEIQSRAQAVRITWWRITGRMIIATVLAAMVLFHLLVMLIIQLWPIWAMMGLIYVAQLGVQ